MPKNGFTFLSGNERKKKREDNNGQRRQDINIRQKPSMT
jgi:hypothetical protein